MNYKSSWRFGRFIYIIHKVDVVAWLDSCSYFDPVEQLRHILH